MVIAVEKEMEKEINKKMSRISHAMLNLKLTYTPNAIKDDKESETMESLIA